MKHCFIVASLLLLTSCMSIGNDFDISKADQLVPGKSTEADAKALLGEPVEVESSVAGGDVLTWKYALGTGIGFGSHGKGIQIAFDKNGKMIKVVKRTVVN